jgi:hypothetical protein
MNEVYRELKEVKEELRAFRQDNIRLHSDEKYISRKIKIFVLKLIILNCK